MKKAMFIGAALAIGAFAQEPPPDKVHIEMRMQDGLAGAGQTFAVLGGQLLGGAPVKGQPYSAEAVTESTQTLADGSHIVNRSSSTIYRDSEGRERREETIGKLGAWSAEGSPAAMVFISDPVAKTSYTLNPKERTAQKMPARIAVAHAGPDSAAMTAGDVSVRATTVSGGHEDTFFVEKRVITPGDERSTKREDLGTQTVEGVVAQGMRTTRTIPAGKIGNDRDINIISERWFSPELQVVVMSRRSDPRMGETTYRLTNINRSEPQHSLFEVPADYKVSSPAGRFEIVPKQENQ